MISKSPDLGQKQPDSWKNCFSTDGKKKKEDFGDFTEELFLVGNRGVSSFKGLGVGVGKDFGGWQYQFRRNRIVRNSCKFPELYCYRKHLD